MPLVLIRKSDAESLFCDIALSDFKDSTVKFTCNGYSTAIDFLLMSAKVITV